jgi:hypothetical protein
MGAVGFWFWGAIGLDELWGLDGKSSSKYLIWGVRLKSVSPTSCYGARRSHESSAG